MFKQWRLIDSGPCSAAYNMALDEAIATAVRRHDAPPTLRLYGWTGPAVSLGCFQKAADVDIAYCSTRNIPVIRRPTGGRAILHGNELTYSFAVRTDLSPFSQGLLESYRIISSAFARAFRKLGLCVESKDRRERGRVLVRSPLCFQSSSYGEILSNNRKIVGSAQKRWKNGLLQQGSVPYAYDSETARHIFGGRFASETEDRMTTVKTVLPDLDDAAFRQAITEAFEETFCVSLLASHPTAEEALLARELEKQKYLHDSWNLRL